jgi:hypothetical protein
MQMFSEETIVFCGGQSVTYKQRCSQNAECKILPIIRNDEAIMPNSLKKI